MNDQYRLNHFFSVLREKRRAFAENYDYFAPKLAPRFNCFAFIQPDEMKLSKIIAALLDPHHSHAQGETFLKLFFSELDVPYPQDCSNIKVDCEVSTKLIINNYRRIDIVVNFDDKYGLAIENKPWASDQYQQITDYAQEMQNKFGNNKWFLVYLSGNSSNPSEYSISQEQLEELESKDYFKGSHFGQVVEWLKKCEAQCQADHVRHFLRDFIAYCENEFLGKTNMIDASLVKDFALQPENLEMSLTIGQQIISIKEELLNQFVQDLSTEFETSFNVTDWKFEKPTKFGYWSKHVQLKFYKQNWSNFYLTVEFDRNECIQFFQSIRKTDKTTPDLPEGTVENLNATLNKAGAIGLPAWSWWCYFSPPYYDWRTNNEPWIEIKSGNLAKMVMQEIKRLADASEHIIDEAEKSIMRNL